jgi:hypothetical protein
LRIFSYRNKRVIKRVLLILLAVVLFLGALVIGRFIYLQRFIVYSKGSAHLDYSQKLSPSGKTETAASSKDYPFETIVSGSEETQTDQNDIPAVSGYYISTEMLSGGVDKVRDALKAASGYNAVLIDVKSVYGNFYYSTKLSGASVATDGIDVTEVDALIKDLTQTQGLTVIARVPAFSDSNFALAHQSEGLPLSSGALWTDHNGCYWLNPYSNDVQSYLSSIGLELSDLGFDEVLYDDFYFPDSANIVWSNTDVTKEAAVADAAKNISSDLSGDGLRVCFGSSAPEVAACASRVIVTTDDASQVETLISALKSSLSNTASQIVFLTSSRDTRFTACGVLRPLIEENS